MSQGVGLNLISECAFSSVLLCTHPFLQVTTDIQTKTQHLKALLNEKVNYLSMTMDAVIFSLKDIWQR